MDLAKCQGSVAPVLYIQIENVYNMQKSELIHEMEGQQ